MGFKIITRTNGSGGIEFAGIRGMASRDYLELANKHIEKASKIDINKHPVLGPVFFGYHLSRAVCNAKKAQRDDSYSCEDPFFAALATFKTKRIIESLEHM